MSADKVQLGLDELKVLAANAKRAGTQDRMIDLMLEWAEAAQAEVERLGNCHRKNRR